jgi:hypothetical protein
VEKLRRYEGNPRQNPRNVSLVLFPGGEGEAGVGNDVEDSIHSHFLAECAVQMCC